MRPYQRARAQRAVRSLLPALLALVAGGAALAQTPLAMTVHTVTALDQPAAVEHDFTITNAGSYSVTVTDLGSKQSAPLASVAMAVTQGGSIVGTPVTSAGTPITFTAAANTTYTIHVVGQPGTNPQSGPVEEDVTDASGNRIFSSIDKLTVSSPQPTTVGMAADNLTVQTSGQYTVALTDLAFPVALQAAQLQLLDNTTNNTVTLPSPGQSVVSLTAGDSYQIFAFGVPASSAAGGLFGVAVTPASGAAIYSKLVPVGSVTLLQNSVSGSPQATFMLGSGGATLSLNDLAFPAVPLSQLGAALVDATSQTLAASVTTTGAQNVSATSTSDSYEVYAYAIPASTVNWGSYSVSVQQGTSFPFLQAQAVAAGGSGAQVFRFDTTIPSAGSYAFTLTDFQFPGALAANGAALAALQNGRLIGSVDAAGSFSATAAQGAVTLLAFGEAGSSPGLMGIDVSPAGGGAAVFDVTQGVGTGFSSTSFTVPSQQSVQANLTDLQFPAKLADVELAVTSGTKLIGQISSAGSSGSLPFTASANTTYNVNVLAQPAAAGNSQPESAGTYAMSVDAAPSVTLTASSTSVTSGGTVTLSWSTQNATSCTASASPGNSAWSGDESTSGGPVTTSAITADTTFSLNCTGGGGPGSASVTVNVTTASGGGGHGGGGAIDPEMLLALAAILALRARATAGRSAAWRARSGPR